MEPNYLDQTGTEPIQAPMDVQAHEPAMPQMDTTSPTGDTSTDGVFSGIVGLNAFDPMSVAVATVMANSRNESYGEESLFEAAEGGDTPVQHIQKINQATIQEELAKKIAKRDVLVPKEADPTGYDNANNAYGAELGNSTPIPELAKPKIGDSQALIGLLATVLGGLGVAPEILKGLTDGAQKQADQENQQNQYNYQTQEKQHQQKLSGLEFGVKTEAGKYNRETDQNFREDQAKHRNIGAAIDDLIKIDTENKKLIASSEEARNKDWKDSTEKLRQDIYRQFTSTGKWTKEDQDKLLKRAWIMAKRHAHSDDLVAGIADDIVKEFGIYGVDEQGLAGKKVDQAQQRLDETTKKNKKADLQKYIGIAMKSKDGWTKDNVAEVEEWLKSIPEEDRDEFLVPAPFETQQRFNDRVKLAETVRHNKASEPIGRTNANTGIGRESRLKGSLGGDTNQPERKPITPAQKAKALKDIATMQKEIDGYPANEDDWTKGQKATADARDALQDMVDGGVVPVGPANPSVPNMLGPILGGSKPKPKTSLPPAKGTVNRKPVTQKPKPVVQKPKPGTGTAKVEGGVGYKINP